MDAAARAHAMTMLALVLVLAGPPDDGVTLQWNAPPECPDAQAVRDEATRRSQGERRPVDATGNVRAEGEEWVLELTLRATTQEQRTIRASSCAALAEAAGLLIAVAADPTLAEEPIEEPVEEPVVPIDLPPPVEEPPTEVTLPGPIATPPPDAPPKRRRSRPRATLRVDAVGQFLRVLPAAAGFGIGGAIGVMWPRARAELRGHYYLASDAGYADVPDAGGRIDLWTITPAGCFVMIRDRPISLPLCAGVELGGMRGRSFGVADKGDATAFFAAALADATLVYAPIDRLGLRLGPQIAITARRPAFHLQGRDALFESGPAAIRLVAGIEVRLP